MTSQTDADVDTPDPPGSCSHHYQQETEDNGDDDDQQPIVFYPTNSIQRRFMMKFIENHASRMAIEYETSCFIQNPLNDNGGEGLDQDHDLLGHNNSNNQQKRAQQ